LLFVHQVPSQPSNLRVRTWRRLQQLGAMPLKQAVYVLPDTPGAREDFEWLKTEVDAAGGDAMVFSADSVDAWSDDELIEEFRKSRQDAYGELVRDLERTLARKPKARDARLVDAFRQRLIAIEAIDFFGSAGRDRARTLLTQMEDRMAKPQVASAPPGAGTFDPQVYRGRLWITRPRPGVDRMSSAWLIRRFIDPQARFAFAADRSAVPHHGVPFDMFGVEFGHHGAHCTFETLCERFGIDDPPVARIAGIVHDLDLKDQRFGAPESATIAALIDGLQLACTDDDMLLAQGMTLFDSLYRSFERTARTSGPRPIARPRQASASRTTSKRRR
jgi:hypothetical protein